VCLVAAEHGPDRLLAGAGRIASAAEPILEVNPRHQLIVALAGLSADARAFKDDAVHLLFDEARVLGSSRTGAATTATTPMWTSAASSSVVLDRGRIAEQGTHQALLRLDGHYAALWRRQSGGFLDSAYMQAAE
jgi:hypothetical protein